MLNGQARPHELSIDDIITAIRKMGDPSYIVLQKNKRYAEVVSFYNGKNNRVVLSIDFADGKTDPKKPRNYKYPQYMNGYEGGYYNIVVTQYEPDNFQKYLSECEVIYNKKEMNGKYQVGSGRVVTVTHDTPFIEDIVPQESDSVKRENVDGVKSQKKTVTDRSLLADALESTVKDEVERKRLGEYKAAIAEIESAQEQLTELRAKIKEMSFAKGPRDTKAINALRFEANKLANRISVLDGKLLRLESMGAIKGVLAREKARAYEKAKQEGKEALAAYRSTAREPSRSKGILRRVIRSPERRVSRAGVRRKCGLRSRGL